jgi:REP element-mobilizing transposase RayT
MRLPRIQVPHIPYHVFARGNNKQAIFHSDEDRLVFLQILDKAHKKFKFDLFTYALMDNHYHLLLQMSEEKSLSSLMHWVQLGYARYHNNTYKRVGHVFQARYHAIVVEKEAYFLIVDRYIHLNAPRAGMVQKPEDYKWSSYRSRLAMEKDILLDHQTILDYFGRDKTVQRQEYRLFTEAGMIKREEWTMDVLQKTVCLGSPEFAREIAARAKS